MFPCRIGKKSNTFGWKIMNKEFIRNFKVHPYTQPNFSFFGYEPRSNFFLRCPPNPLPWNISVSLYSNINPDIYLKKEERFRKVNNISLHFRYVLTQETLVYCSWRYRSLSSPLDMLSLLSYFCCNSSRTFNALKVTVRERFTADAILNQNNNDDEIRRVGHIQVFYAFQYCGDRV